MSEHAAASDEPGDWIFVRFIWLVLFLLLPLRLCFLLLLLALLLGLHFILRLIFSLEFILDSILPSTPADRIQLIPRRIPANLTPRGGPYGTWQQKERFVTIFGPAKKGWKMEEEALHFAGV